jgi:glycine hydroxymethyltransferase
MTEKEMPLIAKFIAEALRHREDPAAIARVRAQVADLCAKFPVYPHRF